MEEEKFKKYNFDDDIERAAIVKADSNYCENCGHRQILYGKDRYVCQYCGFMVFRNDKVRFMYRLNEAIKKEKRKDGKDIN